MWSLKNKKKKNSRSKANARTKQKRSRLRDTENKPMVARGTGGKGIAEKVKGN